MQNSEEKMPKALIPFGTYQHYKGGKYNVIGIAKHSESLEDLVIYEALYDNKVSKLWARPLAMFNDKIVIKGKQIERFKFIGDK